MSDLLTFQPGVSLADGRYLLRSAVQPGRYSVTIHAIRAQDLTAVIIKTPIVAQDKSRFQSAWTRRTFQTLRDLNHPGRSRVLDWFEQDGRPFLVLQKVKGQSLAQRLQQGPLSEAVALQLIRQVGVGLAGIHSQGLLHRDIQPKNIIFRQGVGLPTLVDWGLQPAQVPGDRLSPFGAPEQLQGGDIFKPCLDIYALAATLYAALTGQPPAHPTKRQYWVPNPSPANLAGLVPPRQFCPDLSPETEQAILQGLALTPQWRPATLEGWLHLFPLSQAVSSQAVKSQSSGSPSPGSASQGHLRTQPPPSQVLRSASSNSAIRSAQLDAACSNATPISHALAPRHLAFNASADRAAIALGPSSNQPQPNSRVARSRTAPPRAARPQAARSQTGPPQTAPAKASIASANHLANELRAAPVQTLPPRPTATQRGDSQTMTSTALRPTMTLSSSPLIHLKRLISITVLTASVGLAGGLLLRVLNPGSVAGFSGLGRVQDFPETDWPGEAKLDDVPEGVPQPEYSDDRWDDPEAELPEVVLDEEVYQDEVLAIPSERLEEIERVPQRSTPEDDGTWEQPGRSQPVREVEGEGTYDAAEQGDGGSDYDGRGDYGRDQTYENYGEADYGAADYGAADYGAADYGAAEDSSGDSHENDSEPYGESDAAVSELSSDWNDDWNDDGWNDAADPEAQNSQESWSEDPWVNEAPQDWEETPGITADDFPEPELPPAYEAPAPQGLLLPSEANGG